MEVKMNINFNRKIFYSSRYQLSQEQIDNLINHVTNEKDKSKLNDTKYRCIRYIR